MLLLYLFEMSQSRNYVDIGNLFIEVYQAFPCQIMGREDIDLSNNIILPPSALQKLSNLNDFWNNKNPVLFQILNIDLNIKTHCGVIEFTAEEGLCYIPSNMFARLKIEKGEKINIRNVSLPKGISIRFQPHITEFIKNPNPIEIIQNNLINYFCLTEGDTISVKFGHKIYKVDVIECKPARAIQIVDSYLKIDLVPPKDTNDH